MGFVQLLQTAHRIRLNEMEVHLFILSHLRRKCFSNHIEGNFRLGLRKHKAESVEPVHISVFPADRYKPPYGSPQSLGRFRSDYIY